MKLKPPKMPRGKSKKVYKDFYVRELKLVVHLYWVSDGLYIASIPKGNIDARIWLDNNQEALYERRWHSGDTVRFFSSLL